MPSTRIKQCCCQCRDRSRARIKECGDVSNPIGRFAAEKQNSTIGEQSRAASRRWCGCLRAGRTTCCLRDRGLPWGRKQSGCKKQARNQSDAAFDFFSHLLFSRASYGLVQLRSVPDGASVDLDGRFWLTAKQLDARWLGLPEGPHTITVRKRNTAPATRQVAVDAGTTRAIDFGPGD